MSIVKTDIPMTSQLCTETIAQLVQTYPQLCYTQTMASTAFGNPLQTLVIGSGPRRVLYTAAHHANEWITAPLLLKFVEELARAATAGEPLGDVDAGKLVQDVTIHTLPLVNPDGVDLVTGALAPGSAGYETAAALSRNYPTIPFPDGWKANLFGVDLNLNYPAGWLQAREIKFSQGYDRPGPRDYVGRAPLNQPETIALADYTQEIDPELVLAYHTQGKVIYWQFQDIAVPGARQLAEEFSRVSGYAVEDTPYESSFAGYKDWFIQEFRRPGFTIEAGEGVNPLPLSQFDEIYRDNLGILLAAARR